MKMKLFAVLMLCIGWISCSSDDKQDVATDPEGTVELNLGTYGYHAFYLVNLADNVFFSFEADSFTVYRADITNIGKVDGLSSIQYIPAVGPWKSDPRGWERIAIKPGNGYIIRSHDNTVYTRIYVMDFIKGADGDKVIGVRIKYQSPWLDYK